MSARLVSCPQCGKQAPYSADNAFRPFCSKRCKLIDLGAWAEERYAIAGKPVTHSADYTAQLPGDGEMPESDRMPRDG